MRVIAGVAKGRPLKTLRGDAIRPTSDRVKESLFNILGARVPGARVLDLFAGSGSLGIEALSRGAGFTVFVDASPAAARVIRENLASTGLEGRARVTVSRADRAIEALARAQERFDLVFLDPPYERGFAPSAIEQLGHSDLLAPGGLAVVEHSRREEVPAEAGVLTLIRREAYGATVLSFYQRRVE